MKRLFHFSLLLALALALTPVLRAATSLGNNTASDWDNPFNWSSSVVPTPGAHLIFGISGLSPWVNLDPGSGAPIGAKRLECVRLAGAFARTNAQKNSSLAVVEAAN